ARNGFKRLRNSLEDADRRSPFGSKGRARSYERRLRVVPSVRLPVEEKSCSTAAPDNAATVSLLNESLVEPRLGVSVIKPADRNACTWCVIVGLETFRLL